MADPGFWKEGGGGSNDIAKSDLRILDSGGGEVLEGSFNCSNSY